MRDIARCTLEILDLARSSYSAATLFGRLLIGGNFLWSGADKLLAPAATVAGVAKLGLPVPPMVFAVSTRESFNRIGQIQTLHGSKGRLKNNLSVRWNCQCEGAFQP
jgi:hypothetical protein